MAQDMLNVYDAYESTDALGYSRASVDKRRRLKHHEGECLVHEAISTDEYRILA